MTSWLLIVLLSALQSTQAAPGSRVLLDAHNCYPYDESWSDRIDRALSTGVPLAIEQDLAWYTDPRSGRSWSVLSHIPTATGSEPTMKDYFFERVRPIVEQALKAGDRRNWPLITLNLDFKTEEPEHLEAVWNLLNEPEGQNAAGDWSPEDEKRLTDLVRAAHERRFWIRFYTPDGESTADESTHGWFHNYNFGSIEAARLRWRAAIRAGADFVAVDQYEAFARELH